MPVIISQILSKPGLKHNDYWGLPGVEGTKISVIDRKIVVERAEYYIGDGTLHKTREEKLILVVVLLRQLYFIDGVVATRAEKRISITFNLSNFETANGEYLIISHSPYSFEICYEDSMRNALREVLAGSGQLSNYRELQKSLEDAGMDGFR